jgi:DNA-binding protein HU-beta
MNKSELVDSMASKLDISKAKATEALDAFMESITAALKADDKVTLVGFGTFSVSERSARTGRNVVV